MGYQINRDERLADAVARIAGEELDFALSELRSRDSDAAMHNARKALKRLRALFQSVRDALPREWFRAERGRIAEAGRKISPLRDIHVQIRTLTGLTPIGRIGWRMKRRLLRRQALFAREMPTLRKGVCRMLRISRQHIDALGADHVVPGDLAKGLKRIYRQGRDAFKAACKDHSAEDFHEWRKKAKSLGYGFEVIGKLGVHKSSRMKRRCARLSDVLGDDHDLFMIETALARENRRSPVTDYKSLAKRICGRRAKLQKKAFKLGARIYSEKPSHLKMRLNHRLRR